ncbi:fused MFS/spermidine synthase [Sandarakinorhabdus sp.]|uniref:fused MFS/spermidine synthase n=1 Tax=Sandarakinorhabdus sp. TaxID=1916663 RepID=UPI003F6FCC80
MSGGTNLSITRTLPLRPVFIVTILTGSFLLFLVQPLFGRVVLPVLGGSPNVWNTAMLFYQAALLGGYVYADRLQRWPVRRQVLVHLGLFALAALTLPVGMAGWYPAAGGMDPQFWLIGLLCVSIGPLFFVVSAQAPLLQAWFARTDDAAAANPYFLYAASNLGSFAALIAYPLLVEPLAGLSAQRWAWSGGFVVLAGLTAISGLLAREGAAQVAVAAPVIPLRRRLHWALLAAVASGLLLSTTTHLTTDIMAMPLLWVVPLALYLLSFVAVFSSAGPRLTRLARELTAPALVLLGSWACLAGGGPGVATLFALAGLLLLLLLCVALHGTLAADRPEAAGLTSFYLWMSLGGALGGLFCALIAPLIFPWPWEHPLLLLAAAALLPGRPWNERAGEPVVRTVMLIGVAALCWAAATRFQFAALDVSNAWPLTSMLAVGIAATLALLLIGRRWSFVVALACLMLALGGAVQVQTDLQAKRQRSFFGVYTVDPRPRAGYVALLHGTTMHGAQSLNPWLAAEPMTYYLRDAGIGRALALMDGDARIGIVGLGTGTLACHAKPGQRWTAWEIDPLVVDIARTRFSYISRCQPDMGIVVGDARLTLAQAAPGGLDLLAIDAFSSDAIPLHLMTAEAFALYGRALADDGLLLVHISNRFLDLEPVLAGIARDGGWQARVLQLPPPRSEGAGWIVAGSTWVALSRDSAGMDALVAAGGDWRALAARPGLGVWRDDFASVLPALRWRRD